MRAYPLNRRHAVAKSLEELEQRLKADQDKDGLSFCWTCSDSCSDIPCTDSPCPPVE